ncbi:Serine/threonine-protein kinase PknD [Bythopirellula polymerisocia]|uniref:Serine/threonine-protein kinase PknD n=2 Tax=Bythopirellula polymerisocia TaxID=2528003 RepID=A0A5C6CNA1_9BACT|nr:Serine/threonine-protein kinase PknD [Bythopirellula polymerisocia]
MFCPRRLGTLMALLCFSLGCVPFSGQSEAPDLVWGIRGISSGRFQKPRAIAIDAHDRLYIVDMTARIQVFDVDGHFLRSWHTPESANGRPSGLTIDRQGRLLVADTHYYQMLVYDSEGNPIPEANIGGTLGHGPGEFGFVTDAVEDSQGNFYIAEYGDFDRIQKFSPEGEFLLEWGSPGEEPGQFRRPQNLEIDAEDRIWVVDACNHRVQVFDTEGKLLNCWGQEGSQPGELYYPYDLALDGQGHIYICEYGNHRVQKFTLEGKSLGCWGSQGREPGKLNNPWALARDSQGRLHVLDSNNHRVQRIIF